MKKVVLTILVFVFSVTLCVNYVKFLVYSSQEEGATPRNFVQVDPFTVLDIISDINVPTAGLYADLMDSAHSLRDAGNAFLHALGINSNVNGDFFDRVIGYFKGLFTGVVEVCKFFASLLKVAISFVVWIGNLLLVIYKVIDSLIGTTFANPMR